MKGSNVYVTEQLLSVLRKLHVCDFYMYVARVADDEHVGVIEWEANIDGDSKIMYFDLEDE